MAENSDQPTVELVTVVKGAAPVSQINDIVLPFWMNPKRQNSLFLKHKVS